MATVRVCLLFVIIMTVCDQVPGQPIFGDLLSWMYDDYDDSSSSSSDSDDDDWSSWLDWACSNCDRRRTSTTTTPRPDVPMSGSGSKPVNPTYNVLTPQAVNITLSNDGSVVTMLLAPWDGASSPNSPSTAAPGGTGAATTAAASTAAPTTAAGTTTAASTTTAADATTEAATTAAA